MSLVKCFRLFQQPLSVIITNETPEGDLFILKLTYTRYIKLL